MILTDLPNFLLNSKKIQHLADAFRQLINVIRPGNRKNLGQAINFSLIKSAKNAACPTQYLL